MSTDYSRYIWMKKYGCYEQPSRVALDVESEKLYTGGQRIPKSVKEFMGDCDIDPFKNITAELKQIASARIEGLSLKNWPAPHRIVERPRQNGKVSDARKDSLLEYRNKFSHLLEAPIIGRDAFDYYFNVIPSRDVQRSQFESSFPAAPAKTSIHDSILKGNKMNIQALLNLAGSNPDEFTKYELLPEELQAAMKRKLELQRAQKVEEAVDTIIQMVEKADEVIKDRVSDIRRARSDIEMSKTHISKVERAKAYGMATQNFIPLCAILGYSNANDDAAKIPDSFKVEDSSEKTVRTSTKKRKV